MPRHVSRIEIADAIRRCIADEVDAGGYSFDGLEYRVSHSLRSMRISRLPIGYEAPEGARASIQENAGLECALRSAVRFGQRARALLDREHWLKREVPFLEQYRELAWATTLHRPALHILRWARWPIHRLYQPRQQPTQILIKKVGYLVDTQDVRNPRVAWLSAGLSGGRIAFKKFALRAAERETLHYTDENGRPEILLHGIHLPDTMRIAAAGLPVSSVIGHPAFAGCQTKVISATNTFEGNALLRLRADPVISEPPPCGIETNWLDVIAPGWSIDP